MTGAGNVRESILRKVGRLSGLPAGLCEITGSGHQQPHKEHDVHHNGSSCNKTSPCYHVLKFLPETDEFDNSRESVRENPTPITFAPSASGLFLLGHSNQYFTYLVKLHNKAPDVPLYYRNSSLLF
jgi:hypothetical protein